jgi:hypothetical protein
MGGSRAPEHLDGGHHTRRRREQSEDAHTAGNTAVPYSVAVSNVRASPTVITTDVAIAASANRLPDLAALCAVSHSTVASAAVT